MSRTNQTLNVDFGQDGWMRMPAASIVIDRRRETWIRTHGRHPLALSIGIFDGVHLGHQAVIESAVTTAKRNHGISALLTFSPHPSRVLGSPSPTKLLMPEEWKNERVMGLGMDALIWKRFDADFAAIEAEDFVSWLVQHLPHLSSLHVGANFQFGVGRRGDIHMLTESGRAHGVDVFSVERIQYNGNPISSSRIRRDLSEGNLDQVNRMLGYPYHAYGQVQPGKKLGRRIGFPTLNIFWNPETKPRFGVYAVQVSGKGDGLYPAVANYGLRPSIEKNALDPLLEVHLIDDCPFVEGEYLSVDWLEFLRPEQRFESREDLVEAIARDKAQASKILQRYLD